MKRKLTILITIIMVTYTVFNQYKLIAHASMATPMYGPALYDTFSMIFGNYLGLGKSTSGMNNDLTADSMQTFANNELQGVGNTWNGIDVSGISDKQKFIEFLNAASDSLVKYHTGVEANALYDALNERSYSATGTLATKSIEESISVGLPSIVAMSDVMFRANMQNMLTGFTSGQEEINGYDVAVSYGLFSLLKSGLIATASSSTAEWSEPVASSYYDLSDLYAGTFEWNGKDILFYNVTNFYIEKDGGAEILKYTFSDRIFVIPFLYGGNSTNSYMLSKEFFTMNTKHYYSSKWRTDVDTNSNLSNEFYMISGQLDIDDIYPVNEGISQSDYSSILETFRLFYSQNITDSNQYVNNAESVNTANPALKEVMDKFMLKDFTIQDLADLATNIADVAGATVGTDTAIDDLIAVIDGLAITLPDAVVDGTNDVVQAVEGVGEAILTLPRAIWLEFEGVLEDIRTKALSTTRPWENDENKENSNDILLIFNGLLLLIYIIIILLKIFVHCLQFIINIFAIPPSSALLPEEMVMGLEHLNEIQIPVIDLSVYAFMMGLVYILIVFYAIRILRINIDRIKVPKHTSGGL